MGIPTGYEARPPTFIHLRSGYYKYKRNKKEDRVYPCIVPLSTGIWSVCPPWGPRVGGHELWHFG